MLGRPSLLLMERIIQYFKALNPTGNGRSKLELESN
jgi:hypothetical protein